jgi:Ca-activated chloride channel family protein
MDKVVNDAVSKGIEIYTIGLGSASGVPIPVYAASGEQTGYKKDRYGNVVLTKLDEATLQTLAQEGNGVYYHGSNTDDELEKIYNELAKIEKTEFGATKITEYEDRFYYFLAPALILLIIEFFIGNRKSKLLLKLNKTKY